MLYGSLKIKRPVYDRFLAAREGRETQTEALARLLDIQDGVMSLIRQFSNSPEYLEWKRKYGSPTPPSQSGRDSPEVSHLQTG